jgi:hypothetical protein
MKTQVFIRSLLFCQPLRPEHSLVRRRTFRLFPVFAGILLGIFNVGSLAEDETAQVVNQAESEPKSNSIDMDLQLVRQIAAVHPSAAMALLAFRESHRLEGVNLYRGQGAMPGIPTSRTVELMLDHADEQTLRQSLEPLDSSLALRVKWEATERDPNTLLVTFTSELIDKSLVPKRVINPRTVVTVSKVPPRVISVAHQ